MQNVHIVHVNPGQVCVTYKNKGLQLLLFFFSGMASYVLYLQHFRQSSALCMLPKIDS